MLKYMYSNMIGTTRYEGVHINHNYYRNGK